MPVAAVLFVTVFAAVLGVLIWIVSNLRTDPVGYTHIANCYPISEAERAKAMLEKYGIHVRLDDHTLSAAIFTGGGRGPVRVLVPDERVAESLELLKSHVAAARRERYMRLV